MVYIIADALLLYLSSVFCIPFVFIIISVSLFFYFFLLSTVYLFFVVCCQLSASSLLSTVYFNFFAIQVSTISSSIFIGTGPEVSTTS